MDKSVGFGSSSGGIYVHGSDEIYIPEYSPNSLFASSENELKNKFIGALINSYRTGTLVNVRRHIATSKVGEDRQKCIFNWDGDEILLSDAELLLRSEGTTFYCKSSLIYNVFKYGYKPDDIFIAAVNEKFA